MAGITRLAESRIRQSEDMLAQSCKHGTQQRIEHATPPVGAKVVRDGKSGRWRWEMPKELPWFLREEALRGSSGFGVEAELRKEGA